MNKRRFKAVADSDRSLWKTTRLIMLGWVLGQVFEYLTDEEHGHRRRVVLRDQLAGTVRHATRALSASARYTMHKAVGETRHAFHLTPEDNPSPDDNTLRDRVQSEVFADADVPKGDININVVAGIVELRGELAGQADIDMVVERVCAVPHVVGVRSYLHLPGTPAPNKEQVLTIG